MKGERMYIKKLRREAELQWFVYGFAAAGALCSVVFWVVCRTVGIV